MDKLGAASNAAHQVASASVFEEGEDTEGEATSVPGLVTGDFAQDANKTHSLAASLDAWRRGHADRAQYALHRRPVSIQGSCGNHRYWRISAQGCRGRRSSGGRAHHYD